MIIQSFYMGEFSAHRVNRTLYQKVPLDMRPSMTGGAQANLAKVLQFHMIKSFSSSSFFGVTLGVENYVLYWNVGRDR